jgi:hypothetical protein
MKEELIEFSFFVALFLAFIYAKNRETQEMTNSELQLEKQRAELLKRIGGMGDLRRGSITATFGKCGKPTCHCAKAGSGGHGPNFRLTRKVQGKTVTETFSSPAALRKAQREVEEFHHFQDLCDQVVEVSEQLCAARPMENSLSPQEKKRRKRFSAKSNGK